MAILNHEQPDYYGDFMPSMEWIAKDPVRASDTIKKDGQPHQDSWGVTKLWHVDAPGAHPICTPDVLVIPDIEEWEKYLKVPSLDGLDWSGAIESEKNIDRSQYFCGYFMATGIFERSHFLMGMEDAFCNYLEYPDEMSDLLGVLADYKIRQINMVAEMLHPDVFFFQDDWGHKQGLFLPPDVWREIIKPYFFKISEAIHSAGAMYVHHADCICQPIVEDMIELGIDIWQGVIPQNDIVEIQRITEGKLPMIGGIDVPAFDYEGIDEDLIRGEVRRAIDTYCPGGRFFPAKPSGRFFHKRNDEIFEDELKKYGRIWAQEHPVA